VAEQVDLDVAEAVIQEAVQATGDATARAHKAFIEWSRQVREFSELCARKNLKSYIAVLGNAMLAKASNPRVDVCSLKAGDKSGGAYDARRSAEKVLVPASQKYSFSLGTTGPQPLNNQPFFRSYRIDSDMRVRGHAKPVLGSLLALLHELQQYRKDEAVRALAAFIDVRRAYVLKYSVAVGNLAISTEQQLVAVIASLVDEQSEGGARAQAAAGGLLDALYSRQRVRVGKKNEPDRHVPGDIAVRASGAEDAPFSRVFEVRDKNVPLHAAQAFISKVAAAGIGRAGLIAVASDQEVLDTKELMQRARESGVDLDLFVGWSDLVHTVLFASDARELAMVETTVAAIRERLVQLEVATETLIRWDALTLRQSNEKSGDVEEV